MVGLASNLVYSHACWRAAHAFGACGIEQR